MSNKTLSDISSSVLSLTIPVNTEIYTIFNDPSGVNFSSDSLSDITSLIDILYNKISHKHIMLLVAYKIYIDASVIQSKKDGIIDHLYGNNVFNINSSSNNKNNYENIVFDVITKKQSRVQTILNNSGTDVSSIEKEIYELAKKTYLTKFYLDIQSNNFTNLFYSHSDSDNNSYWDVYLKTIDIALNFTGILIYSKIVENVNFKDYILHNSDFTFSKFINCNFDGADLAGSILDGSDITGNRVHNTNFTNTNLNGLLSYDLSGTPTNIPSGYRYDSNIRSIIIDKLDKNENELENEIINLGVLQNDITDIHNDNNLELGGIISIETQNKIKNIITGTNSEKKQKRHAYFKYLFNKNNNKTIQLKAETAQLPSFYTQENVTMFPKSSLIDLKTDNVGFYSPIEDDEYVRITSNIGDIVFSVNKKNGNYYISKISGTSDLNITNINSTTYQYYSNFSDGDTITVNGVNIFFG